MGIEEWDIGDSRIVLVLEIVYFFVCVFICVMVGSFV